MSDALLSIVLRTEAVMDFNFWFCPVRSNDILIGVPEDQYCEGVLVLCRAAVL